MRKESSYPACAGELTEEERIAVCKALYPEQANKAPENRALWPKDRQLTAAEKMAWSRYVRRPPATRYDIYPAYGRKYGETYQPTDPVLWALRMRRAGLARRLLEEKGPLDWVDASRYAPWTLRWSPSLLKLILDLAPAGEPPGCCHRFTRTGGDWKICVNATLLTAAAALDDIESVELLLEYGYDPAPKNQYGHMLPEDMVKRYYPKRDFDKEDADRYYRHSTLPLDIWVISYQHDLFLIPTDEGFAKGLTPLHPHVYYFGVYTSWRFQPLSAALLCGAPPVRPAAAGISPNPGLRARTGHRLLSGGLWRSPLPGDAGCGDGRPGQLTGAGCGAGELGGPAQPAASGLPAEA